ncbi:hypothetical protein ACVI1L_004795 [Bradyrhizobium sp. USDA 4516]
MRKPRNDRQKDLLFPALDQIIDMGRPLVRLAALIDCKFLDDRFDSVYQTGPGQPGLPKQPVAGLFILKHIHNLSDDVLYARWIENPYYQYYWGELSFCHALPTVNSLASPHGVPRVPRSRTSFALKERDGASKKVLRRQRASSVSTTLLARLAPGVSLMTTVRSQVNAIMPKKRNRRTGKAHPLVGPGNPTPHSDAPIKPQLERRTSNQNATVVLGVHLQARAANPNASLPIRSSNCRGQHLGRLPRHCHRS